MEYKYGCEFDFVWDGDPDKAPSHVTREIDYYRSPVDADGNVDEDGSQLHVERAMAQNSAKWVHAEAALLSKCGLTGWVAYSYRGERLEPDRDNATLAGHYAADLARDEERHSYITRKCTKCHGTKRTLYGHDVCAQCAINTYNGELDESVTGVPKEGAMVVVWGDASDPMHVVVKDGKMVAGYYMSCRGEMWQAGAFVWDSPNATGQWLSSSNCFGDDDEPCGEWLPGHSICSQIGYDNWDKAAKAATPNLLGANPCMFWEDPQSVGEMLADQKAMMTRALQGYDDAERKAQERMAQDDIPNGM